MKLQLLMSTEISAIRFTKAPYCSQSKL